MQKKRVALLGCGSVGGFLALELIRTGLRDLTLVDHEILTLDNVYRHELGKDMVGTYKVLALKQEIERKVPYTKITSIPELAQTAIETGRLKSGRFDLIIIAIGDETDCLHLNELIRSKRPYPPIIFSWLEPYGIGGHTLLTGNASARGCYECLITPMTEDEALYNRASFAAPGQFFAKDISGCGSLFTPYGSTDALQTALLTSSFGG
ncbi:MAG: ThiF family adenylyltransferase [Chloroflexi bacterium]|nr:ThiF family adenylyltransferase [Chloroflexota bacterium]